MKKYILSLCVGLVIILPIISLAQGWVARYNGPGDSYDRAHAIALDNSGNVYVTGASWGSYFDYATVKYDSSGVEQWVARYNGPGNGDDYAYAIALDNSDNIYVTGRSMGSGTGYDYATIKYLQVGVEEEVGSNKQETRLEIYPNPFTTSTSIHLSSKEQSAKDMELQIYDASGRLVKSVEMESNTHQLRADLVPGVYFLKLNGKPVGKVVKVR